MCIGKFCNRNVVCAARDTTIVEAAHLMRRNHVGDVIVVDETNEGRRPIGIVTDRDIVIEVISAGLDPNLVKVATCCSSRSSPSKRILATQGPST